MGWVSCLEDATERFEDAEFLLRKLDRAVAGGGARAANVDLDEAGRQVQELRTILGRLKGHLEEALDYVTDPSRAPLDLDPSTVTRVKEENAQLAVRLANETAKRAALEHELRQSSVKLVGSRVNEREATEKLEFLRAVGGQHILNAGKKKRRHN